MVGYFGSYFEKDFLLFLNGAFYEFRFFGKKYFSTNFSVCGFYCNILLLPQKLSKM